MSFLIKIKPSAINLLNKSVNGKGRFAGIFSKNTGYINYSSIGEADLIKCSHEDNIRNIILTNPKTRNSLSLEMMSILHSAIIKDSENKDLRVIVLSSEGPVFSAGHNLKELSCTTGIDYHKKVFHMATSLMTSIIESPVPVIAKVNGLAAAAGCQLVAMCDIVVCSEKSTFSTPGANFGVFCSTPGVAVGRCIPKSRSLHMLFTGLPLTAQEAYVSGLVSRVVSEDQLDAEVDTICNAIKAKSRPIVALGKQFYYKQISKPVLEAFKMGEEIMVRNINMQDGQEGIKSFTEKRKPAWKH